MHKFMRFSIMLVFVLGLVCFLGCGGGGDDNPVGSVTGKTWTTSTEAIQAAINASGNASWTAGETWVTRNFDESAASVLCGETGETDPSIRGNFLVRDIAVLPKVSWQSIMPVVKQQGDYGTCVAFATCAAMEGLLKIKSKDSTRDFNLSEWFMFYKGTPGTNPAPGGWNIVRAGKFMVATGTTTEAEVPYTTAGLFPAFSEPVVGATKYFVSTSQVVNGLDAMKQALNEGPLVGRMDIYTDFFKYSKGIYRHVLGVKEGGHAICIVGYDDDQQCWICRNSWDSTWGEDGYFRIAYDQISPYGVLLAPVMPLTGLSANPPAIQAEQGQVIDLSSITVTATYDDGSTADITATATWAGVGLSEKTFTSTETGIKTLNYFYGEGPNQLVGTLTITVAPTSARWVFQGATTNVTPNPTGTQFTFSTGVSGSSMSWTEPAYYDTGLGQYVSEKSYTAEAGYALSPTFPATLRPGEMFTVNMNVSLSGSPKGYYTTVSAHFYTLSGNGAKATYDKTADSYTLNLQAPETSTGTTYSIALKKWMSSAYNYNIQTVTYTYKLE